MFDGFWIDLGWILDGFGTFLGFDGFWLVFGSPPFLGCTCAWYLPSYISPAYLPGSSAFYLPPRYLGCTCASYLPSGICPAYLPGSSACYLATVPRMHMCILSPELYVSTYLPGSFAVHLPTVPRRFLDGLG